MKVGKTYQFKIRAYTISGKKKVYGLYSSVKRIKLRNYVKMVGSVKPYSYYGNWGYEEYTGANSLKMGGIKYYNSFELSTNFGDEGYACFNLKEKYKTLKCSIGSISRVDLDLVVLCDDEIVKTITIKASSIPKQYSIPVSGTHKLELRYFRPPIYGGTIGFGNPKLYF